jgi:hypothetical protein
MHDCPICGMACYCDMEDHHSLAPADCCHECDDDAEDDYEEYLLHPHGRSVT